MAPRRHRRHISHQLKDLRADLTRPQSGAHGAMAKSNGLTASPLESPVAAEVEGDALSPGPQACKVAAIVFFIGLFILARRIPFSRESEMEL